MPHLLLVEDHAESAFVIALALTRLKYQVQIANSLAEARQFLQSRGFTLVITDWNLPDGTGEDVCLVAREVNETIRVVVLTAWSQGWQPEILKCKPDAYLTKPVEIGALHNALQQLLEPGRAG